MQNEIHGSTPLQVRGGVLITRTERLRQKRQQNILQAAQQHAKKLILQAQGEAETLRKTACRQGFEQGVLKAAQAVASYMQDYHTLTLTLHQQLQEKAQAALAAALGSEVIFPELLKNWLPTVQVDENSHQPLELLVPVSPGPRTARLTAQLDCLWKGTVLVSHHPENRYVMKYQGQLAEFTPDDFIDHLMPSLIDLNALRQHCEQLSQHGLATLQNQLMHNFDTTD